MKEPIAPEELAALLEFARREGRYWKSHLRHAWATGNYRSHDAQALQTLRNTRGFGWLLKIKINVETGEIK